MAALGLLYVLGWLKMLISAAALIAIAHFGVLLHRQHIEGAKVLSIGCLLVVAGYITPFAGYFLGSFSFIGSLVLEPIGMALGAYGFARLVRSIAERERESEQPAA